MRKFLITAAILTGIGGCSVSNIGGDPSYVGAAPQQTYATTAASAPYGAASTANYSAPTRIAAQGPSMNPGSFPAPDATYLFYDKTNGFVVEYLSSDNTTRYWAPGRRDLVQGRWRLGTNRDICFDYGAATTNTQTGAASQSEICESADPEEIGLVGAISGDAFDLMTRSDTPYVLEKCTAPDGFVVQRDASHFADCR